MVREESVTVQVQLPPPAMLQEYDRFRPGTSELLIRWNEEEQAHRRRVELEALQANIAAQARQLELASRQGQTQHDAVMYQAHTVRSSDAKGQVLGWLLCVGAVGGSIWLGLNGQTAVACVLAAIPTAAIIQSFRSLTRQDARDSSAATGSKPSK